MKPRAVLWLLLLLLAAPLQAQGVRFGISPAEIILAPSPGRTATGIFVVVNQGSVRTHFKILVMELDGVAPAYSAVSMTKAVPREFSLDAKKSAAVRLIVDVPPDARGGRFAGVQVQSSPVLQRQPTGSYVVIRPALVGRLLVSIRGTEVREGDIVSMSALRNNGVVEFLLTFRNVGNTWLQTSGHVTVTDSAGKEVAKIPFPDALVLPESFREFKILWHAPPSGTFKARALIDYGGPNLIAGQLQLTLR